MVSSPRAELRRPLLFAAFKLNRDMRDIASEGIRVFLEMIFEEDHGSNFIDPETLQQMKETIGRIDPIYLEEEK